MSDAESGVHEADLMGWVIWEEEQMMQEPEVRADL